MESCEIKICPFYNKEMVDDTNCEAGKGVEACPLRIYIHDLEGRVSSECNTVLASGGDQGKGGPKIIGVVELRAINALLKAIDDLVQRNLLDSRSTIADARLNCCESFTYFDGGK